MKILIIGAGAIGGSLATRLSYFGNDVTVLEKNLNVVDACKSRGLILHDGDKTLVAKPNVITTLEGQNDKFDCCFTATRAYNLRGAVLSVLPYLADDAPVISMNNGVCLDELAEVVGDKRAVACCIFYGVGITSPGEYYMKIDGDLVMGMKSGEATHAILRIARMIDEVVPCTVTNNIIGTLYSKMLINSCITSSAIISGLTLGEILSAKEGRMLFDAIIKEGVKVAKAAGITVPNYNKNINYYSWLSNSFVEKIKRRIIYKKMADKYGFRTSATLEALKKGVATETEYYNGYILKLAKKYNVETPVNQALVDLIAEIEKDISLIGPENIYYIAYSK